VGLASCPIFEAANWERGKPIEQADFGRWIFNKLTNANSTNEQTFYLTTAIQAVLKVRPFLCGWDDETGGNLVWSDGDLAKKTVEQSMATLFEKNKLWSPKLLQLRVDC
jgi:hypothetical protein